MRRTVLMLVVVLLAVVAAAVADELLAPGEGAPPDKTAAAPAQLKMDEVEIRGELERPEVFYIIPRRKAKMDLGTLSKSYDEEIMEPLLPGPFEARYGIGSKHGY